MIVDRAQEINSDNVIDIIGNRSFKILKLLYETTQCGICFILLFFMPDWVLLILKDFFIVVCNSFM